MGYKVGTDKKQLSLLPVCLDDYISESHICRVIDAFTGQLMRVLEATRGRLTYVTTSKQW